MPNLIGTHNGKFHCDEVFACYMLKRLPIFSDYTIVRTRDPTILEKCDIVVDVGAVCKHSAKRYDHHQRGFMETMKTITGLEFETKLSSAGLIYAYYGKAVIAQVLGIEETHPDLNKLYIRTYKDFVEAIDAIDNGIQQFDGTPRYKLSSTLTSRVSYCNPTWNDTDPDPEKGFERASQIVAEEFENRVSYLYYSWIPARNLVDSAIKSRNEVHPSGKILLFDDYIPWKEHFFELEREIGLEKEEICLAIYKDHDQQWRVQAIPASENSGFENRILLPWKGLRDADLKQISGIPGAVFVHITGFIGGTMTRESALRMAEETLIQNNKWTKMSV